MAEQELRFVNWPSVDMLRALSPNGSHDHFHTRALAVRRVHARVKVQALIARLEPMHSDGPVVMRPVFYFPLQRRRDDDNLSTGVLKAVRDALVRCGYLAEDDDEHLHGLRPQIIVEKGHRELVLYFAWTPLSGVHERFSRDSIGTPGLKKRRARSARKRLGSSSASRKVGSQRAVQRF